MIFLYGSCFCANLLEGMGSSGKVVNLVVGKEVTSISGQFQKSYIGTPTASLSLTLEEGSKLSSIGNDAFKDNSFFVSIDLSNADSAMTFGDSAFNNMANLKEFSTGTGTLTLGTDALSNLKNCETFTLSAEDVKLSTAIGISLTNPATVATATFGGKLVHSDAVTMACSGYTYWDANNYYSYIHAQTVSKINSRTVNTSSATITGVTLTPVYTINSYTHPLTNLGASNGCDVYISKTVKTIPHSLFASGVYIDVTTNLAQQSRTFAFSDADNSKTCSVSSTCSRNGASWTNTVTVNGTKVSSNASATISAGSTNTTDTPFKSSGIKIGNVTLKDGKSELAYIRKAAFGSEERLITTSLTATSKIPTISYTSSENYSAINVGNIGPSAGYISSKAATLSCTTSKCAGVYNIGEFSMSITSNVRQDGVCLAVNNSDVKSYVTDVNLFGVANDCVIDVGSFAYNENLTDIRIGSGAQTIGDAAFFRIADDSTAYIYGKSSNTFKPDSNNGLTSGGHSDIGTITYLPDAKDLGRYIAHYQVGASVTAYLFEQVDGTYVINIVGTGATYETYTESNLPQWHATYGTKVSKVIVDDTVTGIGPYLFYGHTALTSVQFGTGLTSIGAHAFGNCTGLDSFTVPSTLTSVGERILEGAAVKTVYYNANTEDAYHSMSGCDAQEIILGANVTKIGDGTLGDISDIFFVKAGKALKYHKCPSHSEKQRPYREIMF